MAKRIPEVAEAFGADPDELAEETEAPEPVPAPAPEAPPAPPVPPAALTMSVADIQAIVKTAIGASQQGNKDIAEMVTQGIAQARKPIPEGTDASNPRISVYNPLGDRDHPRPGLRCDVFLGTQDPKTKQISRTYPFNEEDLTVNEQIAFNTLQPGNYSVKLYDGKDIKVAVVPELDPATDELRRLVIVVPQVVTGKGSAIKNMLPGPCNLVAQITGKDFSALSRDDLKWFMAEHCEKRYVSEREVIAA